METGKNSQVNVVRSYQRYLKLQRGFSPNTLDAYQRDLQKLLVYLEQEGKDIYEVELDELLFVVDFFLLLLVSYLFQDYNNYFINFL